MTSPLCKLKPLSLAVVLGLTACGGGGGGGGGSTGSGTEVSGVAEAPNGQIALFKENQSTLVAAIETLFPGAYAAITGLQPVTGATVELIRVDDSGAQVGDVLASTTTSITGNYSLALPSGVDFSGDLVLRITGNSGASMSAQVVEQSVDINPISEYILEKFIADGTSLKTLPVNDVVALTGKIEEFDLSATNDLSTMIDQLEAEVGTFVDNEITVITSTPGDGASVAGNWKIIGISAGMHDTDASPYGTFAIDINNESLSIADAGSGNIDITTGASEDSNTNFSVDGTGLSPVASIYQESNIGTGGDTFSGSVDSNGNFVVPFPFEEELQTVDLGTNPGGPDYGWRWPPGTFLGTDTGNGNIKVATELNAGVRYGTTDTNGDGVKDAVDPAQREGDEVFVDLNLLLKQGSGMSTASLNGDYGLITYEIESESTTPRGMLISTKGLVSFDGSGTFSYLANALVSKEMTRVSGAVSTANNTDANSASTAYTLSSDGLLEIPALTFQAQVSSDGRLIAGVANETLTSTDPNNTPADPSDDIVTENSNAIRILTKLGTIQKADVAGATYRLMPLVISGDDTGRQAIFTLSADSNLVFDATGDTATVTASDRGIERASDVAQVEPVPVNTPTPLVLTATVANSDLTLSATGGDEDVTVEGYVSDDTTMFVGRLYIKSNTDTAEDLGIMIGIKQ